MDQAPFEPSKRSRGGDTHTPQARVDIARREEQIVALRLRHIPFAAIARTVGVNKSNAIRAFNKALRRNTDQDISTHHRSELAELDAQQAKLWTVVDNPKESSKNLIAAVNAMNRIHIRRARLLGLDAPQKLDIRGLYRIGGDQQSAERLARERVLEAVPLDEQERMYEVLAAARKRVEAADIDTTATRVTNGPDRSSLTIDPSPDTAEHNEE
jgi:hypothetical protein